MPIGSPLSTVSEPVLELLLQLGRRGARLSLSPHGVTLQATTTATRRIIPDLTVAHAQAAGFLARDGSTVVPPGLVLSAAGRAALRHLLMSTAYDTKRLSGSHPARGRKHLASLAVSSSVRQPMHRTQLQQLAARHDGRGKPLLDPEQVAAGERFAADFEMAGLQPRVTARWSADAIAERRRRSAPGAGVEIGTTAAAAQARVRTALAALGGTLANVVLDVCGLERGLTAVEAERGWPRGGGRLMLAGALEQLARHYGLVVPPRPQTNQILRWGDGDHRPPRTAPSSPP